MYRGKKSVKDVGVKGNLGMCITWAACQLCFELLKSLDSEGSVFFHWHCILNKRFYYCWQLHILIWCARWRACDNFRLRVVSKNLVSILHQILTYFRQFATVWYCHLLIHFFYKVEEGVVLMFHKHELNLLFQVKKKMYTSTHLK